MIYLVLSALLAASHAFGADDSALNCQLEVTAKGSLATTILARAEERAGAPLTIDFPSPLARPGQAPEIAVQLVRQGGSANDAIGEIRFSIRDKKMQIHWIEVMPHYRRLGISELLMLHALSRYPEVKLIEAILLETNFAVMQAALNDRKSCVEALKATPSWRMLERLGFTRMHAPDCVFVPGYVAERP